MSEEAPVCPVEHYVTNQPRLDVVSPTTGRRGHKWVENGMPVWCVPDLEGEAK
jgi:hypothetical protein